MFSEDAATGLRHWRVYYWAERPDAEDHAEDDQGHWHPDSEHQTKELALKRVEALKAGASRFSILKTSAPPTSITKH
jgi:hypothetical protein